MRVSGSFSRGLAARMGLDDAAGYCRAYEARLIMWTPDQETPLKGLNVRIPTSIPFKVKT